MQITQADLSKADHQRAVIELIDAYSRDPMGDEKPLPEDVKQRLIPGLRENPTTLIFLAYDGDQPIGIALCFLPGIYAMVALSLVVPLAVLEKGSASEALLDSNELTKGHRWKILGAGIVIYGFIFGIIGLPV